MFHDAFGSSLDFVEQEPHEDENRENEYRKQGTDLAKEQVLARIDELHEAKFGDNDNLSAMVANLIDADLLLILTDIGGLYTADPNRHPEATLITVVEKIDSSIEKLVSGTSLCTALQSLAYPILAHCGD